MVSTARALAISPCASPPMPSERTKRFSGSTIRKQSSLLARTRPTLVTPPLAICTRLLWPTAGRRWPTPLPGNPAPTLSDTRNPWKTLNPTDYPIFRYNPGMLASGIPPRWFLALALLFAVLAAIQAMPGVAQQPPPASAARILLLPRRVVSGEHATLAVLDVNGRLTPGVSVVFSNGDHLTTDTTGRALFVAPLNLGVISASIAGRSGRVYTTIMSPTEAASPTIDVSAAPRIASVSDRFELAGRGFCGRRRRQSHPCRRPARAGRRFVADVTVLPPADLDPGPASVQASCAKRDAPAFSVKFVALTLEADSSPLAPGDHRALTVRVRGTTSRVP